MSRRVVGYLLQFLLFRHLASLRGLPPVIDWHGMAISIITSESSELPS